MFAGIQPLPAGHWLEIDRAGLRIERWWDYVLQPVVSGVSNWSTGFSRSSTEERLKPVPRSLLS